MAKKAVKPHQKKNNANELGGIAFVGFFFAGMAIGALLGRWDVGPFAGLAMGFIAMMLVMMKK